ncbi:hypothetical protein WH8501_21905 [Crocosphaera watsonii WH 8501]|uniref:Uncharacterized protein n=3 Tax=Crocosphaera watsonii TaxID=263511 RepID=G5J770_CROWT|nr:MULTISPECIES: hypothetical protein [Crocosphaera]EHJ11931.1 hypothetical protein CWATWH0003_3311 [Crocosphaera watsonii WH 0003]MCH2243386.1 hypothetical protein [Crocosphaera sp.]NQZ64316.1 hypothetical protein [Crocosphaera sp.]CCQ58800.1 hypothetical protein CWATWH0005_1094 [Crocosphaera watsonii WH 0005]CCQ62444.1 hypothetical protein CWATWH0401_1388 [Crocosphaera watsonii WH 0401]
MGIKWWFKWWTIAGFVVLGITVLSEPPRLWFWLAILAALIIYGFERAINEDK